MNKEHLLAALKKALEAEMTGHQFYLHAAEATDDPQGKATFTRMAREELEHFHTLKSQYAAVQDNGHMDKVRVLLDVPDPESTSPIFSPQFRERVGQQHFEMSALSVGMQLELNAIKHYQQCVDESEDDDVKTFFSQLVEWEQGHYDGFAEELEQLREDYWRENDFLPY